MAEIKRYFWLKLHHDFFDSKRIKKLRRLAGGDTYTIIYLKMQLKALKTDGILPFTGIEDSIAKEIALDIDEDEENVAVTISYLQSVGLIEEVEDGVQLPYVLENTGSETASAQRVRNYRSNIKALQCNTNVTGVKQIGNVEKEIEKDKELEIDKSKRTRTFKQPTLEELKEFIQENNLEVDAERWLNYYNSNGFMVGRTKMKDWKACVRNWSRNNYGTKQEHRSNEMEISDDEVKAFQERLRRKESADI